MTFDSVAKLLIKLEAYGITGNVRVRLVKKFPNRMKTFTEFGLCNCMINFM